MNAVLDDIAVLVLGTADWNQPIATNQHYMVRELCDTPSQVTFVESLALRRPTLSRRDVGRVVDRLRRAAFRQRTRSSVHDNWRPIPEGLKILSPLVIPVHKGLPAAINRTLISRTVSEWKQHIGPRVLWCYTPTTYGLEEYSTFTVYHCVDLLGDVPGIDTGVIDRNERILAAHGAVAIASSAVVQHHLEGQGFNEVLLWENVADTSVFSAPTGEHEERDPRRVIFAGNLSPSKVDYSILTALAKAGLDVYVAGPRTEGGGNDEDQFEALITAGIHYLGMLPLSDLADELALSTIGIIPYVINSYTRGVSPLKTFEYLAAGLPVVATALPGVSADGLDVYTEQSTADFVDRVVSLTGSATRTNIARRSATADEHSWARRGGQARDLLARGINSSGKSGAHK